MWAAAVAGFVDVVIVFVVVVIIVVVCRLQLFSMQSGKRQEALLLQLAAQFSGTRLTRPWEIPTVAAGSTVVYGGPKKRL